MRPFPTKREAIQHLQEIVDSQDELTTALWHPSATLTKGRRARAELAIVKARNWLRLRGLTRGSDSRKEGDV